jgi:hypothetical protein
VIRAENSLPTIVQAMQEPVAEEARIHDDALRFFALDSWWRTFDRGVRRHVDMDCRPKQSSPLGLAVIGLPYMKVSTLVKINIMYEY